MLIISCWSVPGSSSRMFHGVVSTGDKGEQWLGTYGYFGCHSLCELPLRKRVFNLLKSDFSASTVVF